MWRTSLFNVLSKDLYFNGPLPAHEPAGPKAGPSHEPVEPAHKPMSMQDLPADAFDCVFQILCQEWQNALKAAMSCKRWTAGKLKKLDELLVAKPLEPIIMVKLTCKLFTSMMGGDTWRRLLHAVCESREQARVVAMELRRVANEETISLGSD